jgi:hypothetical protein
VQLVTDTTHGLVVNIYPMFAGYALGLTLIGVATL